VGSPGELGPAPTRGPRLGDLTGSLLRQGRALAADYALLAVLDARSAAMRFAWLVSGGLVAAVLVATAWLAIVAAGIVWLLGTGASWVAALGLAAALNLAGAAAVYFWMRGLMTELPFSATLRQLRGDAPAPRGNDDGS
jgi:hypothetical protein